MSERYVADTSHWEPWQRDYRFGVMLVMPPPHVASLIDAMREAYSPKAHAICSAHISVSDPLHRELDGEAREEIRGLLCTVHPFEVHYDKPAASTRHAGVACPVAPQERFDELKRTIHQASVFAGAVYSRRQIPAHMTIAEFLSIDDSLRLCARVAVPRRAALSGATVWSTLFPMRRSAFRDRRHSCWALAVEQGSRSRTGQRNGWGESGPSNSHGRSTADVVGGRWCPSTKRSAWGVDR